MSNRPQENEHVWRRNSSNVEVYELPDCVCRCEKWRISYRCKFEPLWFNTPAECCFRVTSGGERSSEPQIGIYDFQ
jgi:hypothetical protein